MSATGRQRGFTLIEMLVVLAIAGLMAGIAAPRLQSTLARVEAQGAVSAVASALRRSRAAARLTGTPARLVLEDRALSVAGAPFVTLPAAVRGDRAIVFYPDGTSSGGQIEIAGVGFTVAPATGLFRTAAP